MADVLLGVDWNTHSLTTLGDLFSKVLTCDFILFLDGDCWLLCLQPCLCSLSLLLLEGEQAATAA